MEQCGYTHPRNKEGRGGIYLFRNHKMERFHDFYNQTTVWDAKYKNLSKIEIPDMNQIITYIHILGSASGGIIFPTAGSTFISETLGQLNGLGGSVHLLGIPIPQSVSTFA